MIQSDAFEFNGKEKYKIKFSGNSYKIIGFVLFIKKFYITILYNLFTFKKIISYFF